MFKRGQPLFFQAECADCPVPVLSAAEKVPHLKAAANQKVRACTDLLLHDMGEGLADGRPDFQAGPRDWRTQPLWGLGLSETLSGSTALLHDGRERNVTKAILWHGGEVARSRDAFRRMNKADRNAQLKSLGSIRRLPEAGFPQRLARNAVRS